jgi:hypothetical protein
MRADDQNELGGEINHHLPGGEGLPAVFVFSKLVIGLDCGFAGFTLPERVPSLSRNLLYVATLLGGEDNL